MLHIKDLSKKYSTPDREVCALDGIFLDIARGEFVAIVGASGSGKTTLLNMISGLDIADSGSITFDNRDITKLSSTQTAILRRREVGIIYQFYNLIPELTVRENITLPTELDKKDIDEAHLAKMISAVGLTGRENSYPDTLSGGQKQRVAVARALFNKPSLILADEPTGNLDAENSAEVLHLFELMNKEYGITILCVTHSELVADAASRVIRIENGKIVSDRRNICHHS